MSFLIPLCNFEGSSFLLFSKNVPSLVYYSHLPIIFLSLLLGIFVYLRGRKQLPNKILFGITLVFSFWVFLSSVYWASNRGDVIMFIWSSIILVEPLVYAGSFYLLSVLVEGVDISFRKKIVFALLYLPLAIFIPTHYTLSGFNMSTCLPIEAFFALYYSYGIEIIFTFCVIVFGVRKYRQVTDNKKKGEILYTTVGMMLFLLAFSSGNIIGSITEDWILAQYGLFGMPIFIGFLVYSIVKFRTFNIKFAGSIALIIGLWTLVFSLLFLKNIAVIRGVVFATLALVTAFGTALVKSIVVDIEQRQKIEQIAKDLAEANQHLRELDREKSEFVSIASHQLRTPLTAISGYASMLLEGSYGKLSKKVEEAINRIYQSSGRLVLIIEDFLDISKIEQGRMTYQFATVDMKGLLKGLVEEMEPRALEKSMTIVLKFDDHGSFNATADFGKIRQVMSNLIDNAIKYGTAGKIDVALSRDLTKGKIYVSVQDTGIGISPQSMSKLFQKFSRAEGVKKIYTEGSGLGLYVAQEMMKAHHGRIWAESEGEGEGSTFHVELLAED